MRVLVTGGRGFLGGHVVTELERRRHEVSAPSHADYDLRDEDQAAAAILESKAEAVVHLAANVGGIWANATRPGELFYDNAMMGLQVMEQARLAGVRKLVNVGTACSYPQDAPLPLCERELWNGYPEPVTAPYGMAKKMLAVMGEAYWHQYGFDTTYLIPSNLYGPGDHFGGEEAHVIPMLIRRFLEGGDVTLWGTGTPTRDFLYVEDAARAIAAAAETRTGPEPINIGSGRETSIREVAELIAGLTGYDFERVRWDTSKPDGARRRLLDVSEAATLLRWYPRTPLELGLKLTIEAHQ